MCRKNLYLQFSSVASHNTSLMVTFYIFSIDVSTHAIFIIPADQVVFVLTNSKVLQKAGFEVVRLVAVFPPSTETPTESPKSSGISSTILIAAVVGSVGGVLLLLFVGYCIHRWYLQFVLLHSIETLKLYYLLQHQRKRKGLSCKIMPRSQSLNFY